MMTVARWAAAVAGVALPLAWLVGPGARDDAGSMPAVLVVACGATWVLVGWLFARWRAVPAAVLVGLAAIVALQVAEEERPGDPAGSYVFVVFLPLVALLVAAGVAVARHRHSRG